MESATEDLYFQKLQELVQDEDKIVTLASLAADLGISIQNSQKLITKYVKDQRKLNPNDLAVTYALTGRLKSNGGRAVFMVKEEDLEDKLRLLEEKPSKLIYSVQKNKNVDLNVVALVDMFDATKIRDKALDGSIVSKNCVKRVLKLKKLPPPPPATTKGKSSFFEPKPGKSTDVNKSAEKCPPPKTEQKDKASGSIANLFKTAAAKSNNQNSGKKTPVSNKQTNKRSGGLTGFLTSGSLKSKTDNQTPKKESNKQNGSKIIEIPEEMKDVDVMEIFDDFEEDKKQVITEEPREEPIKKNEESKKQNKRRREKSQQRPSKRRKRIVEHNDSDSDDLFEKEVNNEDIVEKSEDEREKTKTPSPVKELPPKNKRRKAVNKTYTDEEGFVVTKTEYVYETASEDENEVPNPPKQEKQSWGKPEKTKPEPKPKANSKKKPAKNQATLMNFFKKK